MPIQSPHIWIIFIAFYFFLQEKICEESASFDWTSGDIASAIKDLKDLSEKVTAQIQQGEDAPSYDMMGSDSNIGKKLKSLSNKIFYSTLSVPIWLTCIYL